MGEPQFALPEFEFYEGDEAERNLEKAIGRFFVLYALCRVEYEGRAKSELDWGLRVVISKPDGTLLIHERDKHKPRNWQPPGCRLYLLRKGRWPVLMSVRRRPLEIIRIVLEKVLALLIINHIACEELALERTEADLVGKVLEDPGLIEEGLEVLEVEYPTPLGTIDLLARDREGRLVVCEFKRSVAGLDAVSQLRRYVEQMAELHGPDKVRGILVAPAITSTAMRYLTKLGLEYRRLTF